MFFPVAMSDLRNVHQVIGLLRQRSQVGNERLTPEQTEQTVQNYQKSLSNPNVIHLGVRTADGEIAAYMAQVITNSSPNYWLMSYLITNPRLHTDWNYKRNGLEELWRVAFNVAKKSNRLGVAWSLPKSWARTFARTQRESPLWQQYSIDSFAEIPAGTLPTNAFDKWTFGDREKPYDVVLRTAYPTKKILGSVPERILLPAESTIE